MGHYNNQNNSISHAARRGDVLGHSGLMNSSWPAARFGSPSHTQGPITGGLRTKLVLLFSLTPNPARAPIIGRQGQGLVPGRVVIASAQHSEIQISNWGVTTDTKGVYQECSNH